MFTEFTNFYINQKKNSKKIKIIKLYLYIDIYIL